MTLDQVDLKQRLEYLSRAIMCVKSGELGGESSRVGVGELLHDLEEKMEVARVQLQIVDALSGENKNNNHFSSAFGPKRLEPLFSSECSLLTTPSPGLRHTDVSHSLSRLNSDLLDITQLYQDFAEPYQLWECQLAILHCAGHHDPMLIQV